MGNPAKPDPALKFDTASDAVAESQPVGTAAGERAIEPGNNA